MIAGKQADDSPTVAWAKRVNRAWIVHNNLDARADAWLDHLEDAADGRLEAASGAARWMCDRRDRSDDPKPWFYAGLFSLATADEAKHFLKPYRVTMATVPTMEADEDVKVWLRGVSLGTRELIAQLRDSIRIFRETIDPVS